MTAYVAYGVRLESEIPLPGLPAPCGSLPATIAVLRDAPGERRARTAAADSEYLVHGRPLSLRVNGDLEICWQDVVGFRVSIGELRIRCWRGPDGGAEQVREWLLHYALPLLLAGAERLHFLHGGAVEIDGRVAGFLAPSGGGKTTLTKHFLARGHGFLTDEKLGVVARRRQFMAVPSTPFLRRGEDDARWETVARFASAPSPLAVLYLLQPADASAAPAIEPVPAGRAAFELAQRCEFQLPRRVRGRLRLPSFLETSFRFSTQLAGAVRVCRLVVPRRLARLPEVYQAVVADVAGAA